MDAAVQEHGLYVLGKDIFGGLGLGKETKVIHEPHRHKIFGDKHIRCVALGYHLLLVGCSDGLYVMGWLIEEHDPKHIFYEPTKIPELAGVSIEQIVVGCGHFLILTDQGLYTFGEGENGRLGHGNKESLTRPKKVRYFDRGGRRIVAVTSTWKESFVWCVGNGGGCLTFGETAAARHWEEGGQTNHSIYEAESIPAFLKKKLIDWRVMGRASRTNMVWCTDGMYFFSQKTPPLKLDYFDDRKVLKLTSYTAKRAHNRNHDELHYIVMCDDGVHRVTGVAQPGLVSRVEPIVEPLLFFHGKKVLNIFESAWGGVLVLTEELGPVPDEGGDAPVLRKCWALCKFLDPTDVVIFDVPFEIDALEGADVLQVWRNKRDGKNDLVLCADGFYNMPDPHVKKELPRFGGDEFPSTILDAGVADDLMFVLVGDRSFKSLLRQRIHQLGIQYCAGEDDLPPPPPPCPPFGDGYTF